MFTWEVLAESGVVIGTVRAATRRSAKASMRKMFYTGVRVRLAPDEDQDQPISNKDREKYA